MASLDDLPPDQRAVLQLILQRGRSYDEIATLLSIDRGAVRERALAALDAIGPQMGVTGERRGLVGDYLLGQLDDGAAGAARQHIAESPSERAWARVLASELAPLANEPLPEIPSAAPPAVANQHAPLMAAVAAGDEAEEQAERNRLGRRRRSRRGRGEAEPVAAPAPAAARHRVAAASGAPADGPPVGTDPVAAAVDPDPAPRRSSRLGGLILIGLTVIVVAAVAIFALSSSGGTPRPRASASGSASGSATSGATSATTSSSAAAKVVAQINLTPPTGHSKAVGIAEVLQESGKQGIAIVAQHVPPNTTKPPNAYAVWLYNSGSDAQILGFVNPGVGKNGRLSTAGGLPTNAAHFKQLIVTVETKANPKTPGTIVLQGALSGV